MPTYYPPNGSSSSSTSSTTTYVQTADESESAGTQTSSTYLTATVLAGATYLVECYLLFESAAATTGAQFCLTGPTNNASEGTSLHAPSGTTSELSRSGLLGTVIANTGQPTGSPFPSLGLASAVFTTHASAPSPATITVQFKTEVAASAVTLKKGSVMKLTRLI